MKRYIIGLAIAAAPAPAFAQDARDTFGGFYAGPVLGIDTFEGDGDEGETGVLYGGVVGYDLPGDRAIFGAEAELSQSSIDESEGDLFVAGDRLTLSIGYDLYVGLRAGLRVGPAGLLYLKGGYTNLDVNARYAAPDSITLRATEALDGYRLGAGGEVKLSRNLLARLEYRYSDYDSGEIDDEFESIDIKRHQGAASLLFRF